MKWEATSHVQRGTDNVSALLCPYRAPQNLTAGTNQPGSAPSTNIRGEKRTGGKAFTKTKKKKGIFFSYNVGAFITRK